MQFVKIPNLPEKGSVAIVDQRGGKYYEALNRLGIGVITNTPCSSLYDAVNSHPDMVFHDLGEGYMVCALEVATQLQEQISALGIKLIMGSSALSSKYPGSISYNAARVGDFVFHNFKYTDRTLLDEFEKRGLRKINVSQGYTKCSVCIVDNNSIITADLGIHQAAEKNGINSLYIPPQKNIVLQGLDYGFIGGGTGKISKSQLCVFGAAEKLEDWERIAAFTRERGVEIISLGENEVEDFGSLMIIAEA